MPVYVFGCPRCEYREEVWLRLSDYTERVYRTCPVHGTSLFDQVVTVPAVQDWGGGDGEGRFFENLAPKGMRFRDRASYKRHLRDKGLQEWAPKRGMPGQEV